MKFATVSKSLLMGSALFLASSAFAANKASLQLQSPVTINGATLKPGDYRVEWNSSGSNVELSITQGKKVLAKVPAHVVDLQTAPNADATVIRRNDDGTNTLTGVRFGGKKFALEVGEASDGMQSGSSK
jgi:hypothetical protein